MVGKRMWKERRVLTKKRPAADSPRPARKDRFKDHLWENSSTHLRPSAATRVIMVSFFVTGPDTATCSPSRKTVPE